MGLRSVSAWTIPSTVDPYRQTAEVLATSVVRTRVEAEQPAERFEAAVPKMVRLDVLAAGVPQLSPQGRVAEQMEDRLDPIRRGRRRQGVDAGRDPQALERRRGGDDREPHGERFQH